MTRLSSWGGRSCRLPFPGERRRQSATVRATLLLLYVSALSAMPTFAAVSGTITNGTTGKPQAATKVTLYKFGQGGMEPVASVQTDAQGGFSFDQAAPARGPALLRVELDNVTYNRILPPGSPTTGLTFDVYNASRQPGPAKVGKHMLLFQPGGGQMTVNETFLYENPGHTTWADPQAGTLRFYLPAGAQGKVEVEATAPDGMPVPVPTDKSAGDVYVGKFEIKPGETRFDLNYTVPYSEGSAYAGKIPTHDDNTYLIAPKGVVLDAAGLQDLGAEPRTQAHIYGLNATAYSVKLTGTVAAEPAPDSAAAPAEDSGPRVEQIMPRIYGQAPLILGLALGILALGFTLLYRAKDTHERGRG